MAWSAADPGRARAIRLSARRDTPRNQGTAAQTLCRSSSAGDPHGRPSTPARPTRNDGRRPVAVCACSCPSWMSHSQCQIPTPYESYRCASTILEARCGKVYPNPADSKPPWTHANVNEATTNVCSFWARSGDEPWWRPTRRSRCVPASAAARSGRRMHPRLQQEDRRPARYAARPETRSEHAYGSD